MCETERRYTVRGREMNHSRKTVEGEADTEGERKELDEGLYYGGGTMQREIVIDRARWARTDKNETVVNGAPRLLNEEGGMCCLGFYCE